MFLMDSPESTNFQKLILVGDFEVMLLQMPRHVTWKETTLASQADKNAKNSVNDNAEGTKHVACSDKPTCAIKTNTTCNNPKMLEGSLKE